jgi:FdrA protein
MTPTDHNEARVTVRTGSVAVLGATGSGVDEVASLVHNYGAGVSVSRIVSDRDLGELEGGAGLVASLDALDDATNVVVLVSKPPSPAAVARVLDRALGTGRKVVAALIGYAPLVRHHGVTFSSSLEDAARAAAVEAGVNATSDHPTLRVTIPRFTRAQRWIRGFYAGGGLACEAAVALSADVRVASNTRVADIGPLDGYASAAHVIVDFGDITGTGSHPRYDLGVRAEAIRAIANDPTASVLLFDVPLGRDAHPNPAHALVPAIRHARDAVAARGGTLVTITSVTGTSYDAQNRAQQVATLTDAGVEVFSSNAAAVRRARAIVTGEYP